MKCYHKLSLALVILFATILVVPSRTIAQQEKPFQYVSPKPNSEMVSNETNIILRHTK